MRYPAPQYLGSHASWPPRFEGHELQPAPAGCHGAPASDFKRVRGERVPSFTLCPPCRSTQELGGGGPVPLNPGPAPPGQPSRPSRACGSGAEVVSCPAPGSRPRKLRLADVRAARSGSFSSYPQTRRPQLGRGGGTRQRPRSGWQTGAATGTPSRGKQRNSTGGREVGSVRLRAAPRSGQGPEGGT